MQLGRSGTRLNYARGEAVCTLLALTELIRLDGSTGRPVVIFCHRCPLGNRVCGRRSLQHGPQDHRKSPDLAHRVAALAAWKNPQDYSRCCMAWLNKLQNWDQAPGFLDRPDGCVGQSKEARATPNELAMGIISRTSGPPASRNPAGLAENAGPISVSLLIGRSSGCKFEGSHSRRTGFGICSVTR